MRGYLEVTPGDFVAVDRITNIKVAAYTTKEGADRWAVVAYVDYGYGKEVDSNAVYILSEHETRDAAMVRLAEIVGKCGGAV